MISCPSCSNQNQDVSKFCSECGAALGPEFEATVTYENESHAEDKQPSPLLSDSSHHGRFLPGTKIANRYRIVSLVGKGGMGEVYRADDLTLGHTVALKFLPSALAENPKRLEFFLNEVRLTRQISHPNVCRVYDIGEMDGQKFLSMEYIDGEDLRILLRRIGKLPQDKGVQIAQQLCAGLAAAHEKGVLHRDLKPANIMLDGRGQVRITDFGLAKLAEEETTGEIAGTPAYMAPEQLSRGEATIQSDLFSLGLILYELFTGKPARSADSISELLRTKEESTLSQTLELPSGIDPAVQRAISRCLEREPHERPISAKAVAASLPGGDPLAAALAAGETPSPELVAAAGESGLLSLKTAAIYLTVTVVGLMLLIYFYGTASLTKGVIDPVEVFAKTARDLLTDLKHDPAAYERYQFDVDNDSYMKGNKVLKFWYRCSPDHLFPEETDKDSFHWGSKVKLTNPPLTVPGMAAIVLDGNQTLHQLSVIPEAERKDLDADIKRGDGQTADNATRTTEQRFLQELAKIVRPAFKAANLPIPDVKIDGSLSEPFSYNEVKPPKNRPPFAVDDYFVLEPKDEADLDGIQQIELALADRKLVYFNVVKRSVEADSDSQGKGSLSTIQGWTTNVSLTISLLILPVTMILAWRNSLLGRSDRKTAWRVAVFFFFVTLLERRLSYGLTLEMFRSSLLLSAGVAFQYWVDYLALEPIVRKFWPGILTAWSRAMTGRWRDPSLGHSLLIGAMMSTIIPLFYLLLVGESMEFKPAALSGNTELLAVLMRLIRMFTGWGIYITIILVLCRIFTRSDRWAAVLATILMMIFWFFPHVEEPNPFTIVLVVYFATVMFFLIRRGAVAAFTFLFCHHLLVWMPFSHDLKGPDLGPTVLAVLIVLLIAGFGFYTSVGGRRFFANLFASESLPGPTS